MRASQFCLVISTWAACAPTYVTVQVDAPVPAHVIIEEGAVTPSFETDTPFRGNFEAVSTRTRDGIRLLFELDQATARRYGAEDKVTLYGRLAVGQPTSLPREELHVAIPEDKLRALLRGELEQVWTFVIDHRVTPPKEVARLVLQLEEF